MFAQMDGLTDGWTDKDASSCPNFYVVVTKKFCVSWCDKLKGHVLSMPQRPLISSAYCNKCKNKGPRQHSTCTLVRWRSNNKTTLKPRFDVRPTLGHNLVVYGAIFDLDQQRFKANTKFRLLP